MLGRRHRKPVASRSNLIHFKAGLLPEKANGIPLTQRNGHCILPGRDGDAYFGCCICRNNDVPDDLSFLFFPMAGNRAIRRTEFGVRPVQPLKKTRLKNNPLKSGMPGIGANPADTFMKCRRESTVHRVAKRIASVSLARRPIERHFRPGGQPVSLRHEP